MKRLHSLLLMALCLLAACDPSPSLSPTGGWRSELSSIRVDPLTGNNTEFPPQRVCGSTAEQLITVFNEEQSARQISFAEATEPFVLTAIQDPSGTRVGLPFDPVALDPGKSMSFIVKFSPRVPKDFTGYLTVYSDAPDSPLRIPLQGKGTGPRLELSASSLTLSLLTATSDAGVSEDGGTSLSSSATGTIRLTNSGNAPLTSLSLVGPGSSSFSAHLSKSVTTSAPLGGGDFVDLVVTFNPTTTEPISTDTLSVVSDDPCMPAARIELTGFRTTGAPTVVAPTALTFAEQEVGTRSAPQSVKVLNGGDSELLVDSISIRGDSDAGTQFLVSPSGTFSLAPGASRNLSVWFNPTAAGHPQATLQLTTTSSGASFPPISLSGDAVQAALSIEATSIDFSTQTPGQTQTKTVIVRNPGSSPLTVNAAVASPDTSLNLTVNPASFTLAANGDSQELVVTLRPSSSTVAGPWNGELTLASGVTATPSRQTIIPIHGSITLTSVILSEIAISFNDHVVGAPPQEKELVLRNTTALPVTVYKDSTIPLEPFSVTDLPVIIPSMETQKVKVLFNPTNRNQWDVSLQLTSDASGAMVPVKLSGKAIKPELSISSPLNLLFGIKAPDTETSETVTLRNTGDSLLTIKNIALSNTTDYKIQGLNPPRNVAAGELITFDVIFNPKSLGPKGATLQFYVGDSSTPLDSPQINLNGTSSGPLVILNPSKVLNFEHRRFNETAVMTVRITNDASASETLQIESASIVATGPGFDLGGSYTGLQASAGDYIDIQVKFTPNQVDKSYTGTLKLKYKGTTTNISRDEHIELQGWGATALLKVATDLRFGAVKLNDPLTQKLILTNEGKSNLKISKISGYSGTPFSIRDPTWPMEVAPGAEEEISITFIPTTLDAVTANLEITSNATDRDFPLETTTTTTVLLSGMGAAPRAAFPRTHLGFGNVPIGQTGIATLRITNEGSADLCFEEPNPSAHFQVQNPQVQNPEKGWPLCIPAQAGEHGTNYFDFKFEFKPDSEAPVSESITLTSNDAGKPGPITLEGTGTKPRLSVPSSVNFGRPVRIGGSTEFQEIKGFLPMQNVGKAPLIIKTLSVTGPFCVFLPSMGSCVRNTPSDFALTLEGPEPQVLELRVTPESEKISERITITTNEGAGDDAIKTVALLVGTDGVFIQSEPLNFGTCAMDERSTRVEMVVNLWNTAKTDDEVKGVSFTGSDGLDFKVENAVLPKVPANEGAELKLSFKPRPGAAGQRNAKAYIYTKDRDTPLVLDLVGSATGSFSGFKNFKPKVDFFTKRLHEPKETVLFPLENQIDRPIFVTGYALEGAHPNDFTVEPDELSCRIDPATRELEIRTGEICNLKLTYVAQEERDSSAALVLEVSTREGDTRIPATRVTLVGKMVHNILTVTPGAVDFGQVDLGESIEPMVLTVINTSRVESRVLIPEVSHPEIFSVEALEPDKEILPGDSTQLRVTFHPTEGGDAKGELRLRLRGEEEPDVTIDLHGQVLALDYDGGGCSNSASGGGPLWAGGLLLMALGARRRSRKASPGSA